MDKSKLDEKDKSIIERDEIITNFHKFLEILKYDLEEMLKSIEKFFGD